MTKQRGAPKGNRNRMTHGMYSRQFREKCEKEDAFIADCERMIELFAKLQHEIDEKAKQMPGATKNEVIAAINASRPKVSIWDLAPITPCSEY